MVWRRLVDGRLVDCLNGGWLILDRQKQRCIDFPRVANEVYPTIITPVSVVRLAPFSTYKRERKTSNKVRLPTAWQMLT
jgi:hypothetical protein